jgi:hypothetical protein
LGLKQIKIFEIGTVFTEAGETTHMAFGIRNAEKGKKKETEDLKDFIIALGEVIGVGLSFAEVIDGVAEINLGNILRNLPEPTRAS